MSFQTVKPDLMTEDTGPKNSLPNCSLSDASTCVSDKGLLSFSCSINRGGRCC